MIARRSLLALAAPWPAGAHAALTVAPRRLDFPRDHGAHLEQHIEWWYVTGALHEGADATPAFGFQLTFFRLRTGLAENLNSRFAARQLLFAHAALTDLAGQRMRHAERIARWNGLPQSAQAAASLRDAQVHIGPWSLRRDALPDGGSLWHSAVSDSNAGFAWQMELAATQPLLLQGDAGFSRKGPAATQASHYVSQPQLRVQGELRHSGRTRAVRGTAWLDHEWSDKLLPDGAVGWDWIGINLADGGALTAFVLRRADGSSVWAGGSHRPGPAGTVRNFGADEVRFAPLARWRSKSTKASYPVRWRISTPAGHFELRALLDDQELDAQTSTGTVYWEGLAELLGADGGQRLGLGYLEMTGYAAPLRLGQLP